MTRSFDSSSYRIPLTLTLSPGRGGEGIFWDRRVPSRAFPYLCDRVASGPMSDYTEEHARAGIDAPLPPLDTWPNQYRDYEITVEIPEYNAICPKTGLPDFGNLTLRYVPDRLCLELKSLKLYIVAYRDVGIFYENAVNRILDDCVAACRPIRMRIVGTFSSRGGISSVVEARYPRVKSE